MRAQNFNIHELIEALTGTCNTLSDTIEQRWPGMTEGDLTDVDYTQIDLEIFLCAECGWWCEISEAASEEAKEAQDKDLQEEICHDCCPED